MRKLITILCVSVALASCETESVKYFEFDKIGSSHSFDTDKYWVIVHNPLGQVMDVKQFEGQPLVFERPNVPESIGVTIVRLWGHNNTYCTATTYLGIKSHQKWLAGDKGPGILRGEYQGQVDITLTDAESAQHQCTYVTTKWDNIVAPQFSDNTFTYKNNLNYTNENDYLIIAQGEDGKNRYQFLENLSPGNTTLSFNDLKEFDKEVTFKFPAHNWPLMMVRAFDEDVTFDTYRGYILTEFHNNSTATLSELKGHYLNRFNRYYTFLYVPGLYYQSYGDAPEGTVEIKNDFVQQFPDTTFSNFSFTNTNFQYRSTMWKTEFVSDGIPHEINWTVYSKNGFYRNMNGFPPELIEAYPYLDDQPPFLYYSTFVQGTKTYEQFVDETFKYVEVQPFQQLSKNFGH